MLSISVATDLFYKDFFEPPSKVKAPKAKKPPKAVADETTPSTSKVRFHEEVRVRKIKAKGKNLPVSTMFYEEDDEDEDDDYAYEDEEGVESDDDEEDEGMDEDEDDEMLRTGVDDDESQDDVSMEDEEESGLATMERFKDDLFADDDDDKPQEGVYSLTVHSLMTQLTTRF